MGAHPNCKKIALITGANRRIGFEVARQLGRRGMAVIIGTRDPQRGLTRRQRSEGKASTHTPCG